MKNDEWNEERRMKNEECHPDGIFHFSLLTLNFKKTVDGELRHPKPTNQDS